MSEEVRSHLTDLLTRALGAVAPQAPPAVIELERPRDPAHGDFATNVAMQLARALKAAPRKIAGELVASLPASDWIEPPQIAGGGFINFRLKPAAKQRVVPRILAAGEAYGRANRAQGRKVMVEFVSANPTGPLHVGHGRQAALGDAIASLLEWQGWSVSREFYYNDAGAQIINLALSVQARVRQLGGADVSLPEGGYHGEYIVD